MISEGCHQNSDRLGSGSLVSMSASVARGEVADSGLGECGRFLASGEGDSGGAGVEGGGVETRQRLAGLGVAVEDCGMSAKASFARFEELVITDALLVVSVDGPALNWNLVRNKFWLVVW